MSQNNKKRKNYVPFVSKRKFCAYVIITSQITFGVNFTFGNDNKRISDLEAEIPIWVGKRKIKITVRIIPGNCELLIGSK